MSQVQTPKVESVSTVVSSVKNWLETHYRECLVEGEITNLSHSGAGHSYFTLSDDDASLSAAIFKMDAIRNPLIRSLKDGDKVICLGTLTVYPKRGSFQIVVKKIFASGLGSLMVQFESLKKKLEAQGLFSRERKRPIPACPKRMAIITALTGAALHDFINVFERKSIWMDLLIIPAVVQGAEAPRSLCEGLKKAIKIENVEVIILARGGGSLEDLWAFNDENLARAIFNSPIPVVSAVGHQVDFTIADFVADLRAETPTAAAELLAHGQNEYRQKMQDFPKKLKQWMRFYLTSYQSRLNMLTPEIYLQNLWNRFATLQRKMSELNPSTRAFELLGLHELQMRLDENLRNLMKNVEKKYETQKQKIAHLDGLLRVLNPNEVLARGFVYLSDQEGKMIMEQKSYKKLPRGESIIIKFKDGEGKAKVDHDS